LVFYSSTITMMHGPINIRFCRFIDTFLPYDFPRPTKYNLVNFLAALFIENYYRLREFPCPKSRVYFPSLVWFNWICQRLWRVKYFIYVTRRVIWNKIVKLNWIHIISCGIYSFWLNEAVDLVRWPTNKTALKINRYNWN